MWVRVHRAVAIALVAPLVVWSVTGLLFHMKPGWGRAYDLLDVSRGRDETLDAAIDRVLAIVGLVAIWVAAAAGLVLFVRRRGH